MGKNSVETKRKKSRVSGKAEPEGGAASEQVPFQFQQKETESQIRKRKVVADGLHSEAPEIKKKKKKAKNSSKAATKDSSNSGGTATEKVKSKKSKKTENRNRGKSRETGDRSAILKSVFG